MRRLSIALYLLVALAELIHWAIVPLIPAFAARFSLSEVQSGALVASTGLATLVVSVPAGMLADRLGASPCGRARGWRSRRSAKRSLRPMGSF